jgi:hypothetical protein
MNSSLQILVGITAMSLGVVTTAAQPGQPKSEGPSSTGGFRV